MRHATYQNFFALSYFSLRSRAFQSRIAFCIGHLHVVIVSVCAGFNPVIQQIMELLYIERQSVYISQSLGTVEPRLYILLSMS